MTKDQRPLLSWRDGNLPFSTRFDDPYFSDQSGLAETRHVFLGGNDLPARFRDGFAIGELGFGTGLNFLATCQLWLETRQAGTLQFTSFEAFALDPGQMARAHQAFPELAELSQRLCGIWTPGAGRLEYLPGITLEVVAGDARASLPNWGGQADAWFLDGFSPAKNPELWEPELMQAVAAHMRPSATLATYTAAGFVRRGLEHAGIAVERQPGYGRKRHMMTGQLKA